MLTTALEQRVDFDLEMRKREAGFYIDDLAAGAVLDIETAHHHYRLEKRDHSRAQISGHPTLCPQPVEVEIEGSIATEPMTIPNPGFIGRGMYLVFKHPRFAQVITTSRINEIHRLR